VPLKYIHVSGVVWSVRSDLRIAGDYGFEVLEKHFCKPGNEASSIKKLALSLKLKQQVKQEGRP